MAVEQFAEAVSTFSSQYGNENGISYTVVNLAGEPSVYPSYGDFTQACVFRTYGPWWKICPSAVTPIGRTKESFISEDYVELRYEESVQPTGVKIYETYNAGTVVKVLACDTDSGTDVDTGSVRWVTLWQGNPQTTDTEARIFSPYLKKVDFYTNLIRVEFCHKLCEYYTELDAVKLIGLQRSSQSEITKENETGDRFSAANLNPQDDQIENRVLGRSLQDSTVNCNIESESDHHLKWSCANLPGEVTVDRLSEVLSETCIVSDCETVKVSQLQNKTIQDVNHQPSGFFTLPEEVIQLILSYLGTCSLCLLAQTCKLLHSHCYDPMQFTQLNLKPYWSQVNDRALRNLTARCSLTQKLDMSWCGNHGLITPNGFQGLLTVCLDTLTCLRLGNCGFVTSAVTAFIGQRCPLLQELDLQCCSDLGVSGFKCLGQLSNLSRLNLNRTQVDLASILQIVRGCHRLEHLNLGSCTCLLRPDIILKEIGKNCPNLKSLDLWRWRSISEEGIEAIAKNCPHLEEIDVGWVASLRSSTGCYRQLAQNCRKLKKLVFTANRSVCDDDLLTIAQCCPDLEQLDILGTREVTMLSVQRILVSCKNMKFFDVSFCHFIGMAEVESLRQQYPRVDFKQSFQN